MMSFVSAGDIFKLGVLFYRLWEFAFSKAKNAERQYAEFGANIQFLAKNLENLGDVIANVTKKNPCYSDDHAWDLKSLTQICGDFRKTLSDCSQLLKDEAKFGKGREGFIYNIRWNLTIEPEVTRLRDRVAFQNIKISTILKPLELKLFYDMRIDLSHDIHAMHGDLASRMTEVYDLLEGHLERTNTENGTISKSQPNGPAQVPEWLENKFEIAAKAANPELQDDEGFPLAKGINAFHRHFEESTFKFKPEPTSMTGEFFANRTPDPSQYLNTMKAIWIVQKIKKGEEYRKSSSDRLWKLYIKELDEKCLREFTRFSQNEPPRTRLEAPDQRNLILRRDEEFRLWLDEAGQIEIQCGTDYLNQILHLTMSSSMRNQKQELVLLRQADYELEMQTISSKLDGQPGKHVVINDINLARAHLAPLYAYPRAASEATNIVFKGNRAAGRGSALSFLTLKDLLDFQQVITGYKTIFDEVDIKVLSYTSTGIFKGKQTPERGRVQIWNPRQREPLGPNNLSGDFSNHRKSVATGSSTAPSLVKSISTTHRSLVQTEDSLGVSFQPIGLPMLVFFLEPDSADGHELSFLTIQMDDKTIVKDHSCKCGRKRTNCTHSTIERRGELVAQRVRPEKDDDELNLAAIGTYQKPRHPDLVKKMKYLHIDFKTQEDRIKFEEEFGRTKCIYKNKKAVYHGQMWREMADHLGLNPDA